MTKNVYFIDDKSSNVKVGTHALFDGPHFTIDYTIVLIVDQTLQRLGYTNFDNEFR